MGKFQRGQSNNGNINTTGMKEHLETSNGLLGHATLESECIEPTSSPFPTRDGNNNELYTASLHASSSMNFEDDAATRNSSITRNSSGKEYSTNFDDSKSGSRTREAYIDPVVAEKELKAVFWSRMVLLLVILIALIIMATSIYAIITNEEKKDFETQFANYASEITTIAQQNANTTIDTVETFSATITSYALATNSKWPFVTVQDFSARASRLAKLTNSHRISIAPLVQEEQFRAWVQHSNQDRPRVFKDAIEYEKLPLTVETLMNVSSPVIFKADFRTMTIELEDRPGPYLVMWQNLPLLEFGMPSNNYNILNGPRPNETFRSIYYTNLPMIEFLLMPDGVGGGNFTVQSQIMQPIFSEMNTDGSIALKDRKLVGVVWLRLDWVSYFENLLTPDVNGIILVLSSSCRERDVFTFEINGLNAIPLGLGDLHDTAYDYLGVKERFVTIDFDENSIPDSFCVPQLNLALYPSEKLEDSFKSNDAIFFALGVVVIFVFATFVFLVYDFSVQRHQRKVMARVIRQDKIVSNMFPAEIRNRLYDSGSIKDTDNNDDLEIFGATPLAELYPAVTVIFADIAGFTAWSSAREPPQVFTLLETIYSAFDKIAYSHGVFKVETVGDCYVAVGGMPEIRGNHAILVAKFARDILDRFDGLTHKLEMSLGPDTTDLDLRIGIHTGQVTAGVLRGERSRFQLFGDTVNTAARMEETGSRNRIQISSTTADELKSFNKKNWIEARQDKVTVKGKGQQQTYWLQTKKETKQKRKLKSTRSQQNRRSINGEAVELPTLSDESDDHTVVDESEDDLQYELDDLSDRRLSKLTKTERLVEWNVKILSFLLQQILAARDNSRPHHTNRRKFSEFEEEKKAETEGDKVSTVLDEFKEIITLPIFGPEELVLRKDPHTIKLSETVISQLRDFISHVAGLYRPNAFHNFEHASHVTASVRKLLSRIVSAGDINTSVTKAELAGHSFGITSDPLTQFAVVFSAVIHDADHPGVPNVQLLKENTSNAKKYKKSIAEQNSVDLAWDLLMAPKYTDLRACIVANEEEHRRFRQLVVNTVMATDIADKELQTLRKSRWEVAFAENRVDSTPELDVNRKATIVIEHLIQASDVSHTMQHWEIYKQWNERFFLECYSAFKAGRAGGDPSTGWYKGEIGFFDFYIIPLAKKLDDCGVFGVSSHEYLNYALANREEWIQKGESIVQSYLTSYEQMNKAEFSEIRS